MAIDVVVCCPFCHSPEFEESLNDGILQFYECKDCGNDFAV